LLSWRSSDLIPMHQLFGTRLATREWARRRLLIAYG
jgi:hypothetical protein